MKKKTVSPRSLENLEKSPRRNPDPARKKIARTFKLDPDVIEWIDRQPSKVGAIEKLIRSEIARSQSG